MRVLVFTLRPDGTSLWLSKEVAKAINARENARLTQDQYSSRTVQEYLSERLHKKAPATE